MPSDGPGATHGITGWFHEPSGSHTDDAENWVVGKQKLVAFLDKNPQLRNDAADLFRNGLTDPSEILAKIKTRQSGNINR